LLDAIVRHDLGMADEWTTVKAQDIRAGDLIRYRGSEFEVARIDTPFLGRDSMLCFIEDTPDRWHAYPTGADADVEVRRAG